MRQFPTIIITLALLVCQSARAADERKLARDVNPDVILHCAQEMSRAMIAEEFDKFVDHMFAKVVAERGGRDKLIAKLKSSVAEMKKAGYAFKNIHVDEPTAIADAGADIVAIVPQTVEMTSPRGKMKSNSYLIGVSGDGGKTWTFIDGAGENAQTVKALLPNFPNQLKLPGKQQSSTDSDK